MSESAGIGTAAIGAFGIGDDALVRRTDLAGIGSAGIGGFGIGDDTFIRRASLSGDGEISTARDSTQKSRRAAATGDGITDTTRATSKSRATALLGAGERATARTLSKPRTPTITGDGQTSTARETAKTRLAAIHGRGEVATARGLAKPRNPTLSGDGRVAATRNGTQKPRATALVGEGEVAVGVQFREAFPSELTRNLAWDYDTDELAFVSEWARQVGPDDAGSVALYLEGTFGDVDPCTPTAIVEYDADGDGTVDERSLARSVPAPDLAVVFPELSGGDGYYRTLLRDLRPRDILTAVIIGPTHT